MQKVAEKKSITFREPMVVLPLREWKRMEEDLEDREDAERFRAAFRESRGKRPISLDAIRKKYNLWYAKSK